MSAGEALLGFDAALTAVGADIDNLVRDLKGHNSAAQAQDLAILHQDSVALTGATADLIAEYRRLGGVYIHWQHLSAATRLRKPA